MSLNHETLSAPMRAGIAVLAAGNIAVGLVASTEEHIENQQLIPEVELSSLQAAPADPIDHEVIRFTTTTEKGTEMRLAVVPPTTAPPQPAAKPAVEPAPATAPAGAFASACYQYEHLFAQYDWPLAGAMRTGSEESSCNPNAVSDTNDHGIMQINDGLAIYGERIYDPAFNIQVAYQEKYVTPRRGRRPNFSAWFAVCTKGLRPLFKEVHCQ